MKTNMMIVTAAISAGVAEGLKKRMQGFNYDVELNDLRAMMGGNFSEIQLRNALIANNGDMDLAVTALFNPQPQVQNQQVVQQEDQTTRAYAQSLYDAASDYTDELTWNGSPGGILLPMFQCPKELRTMWKDNQGNYIVLVGEEHFNGGGFHGTVQAEKVLTALQAKPEGVNGIAAIELPMLESEDEPQFVKHNKDAKCTEEGIPTMQTVEVIGNKMSKQKETKKIPNCKVSTAFEDETADFVSDKTVVGSGAGREDSYAVQNDAVYKYGTKPTLLNKEDGTKPKDYEGSINHSVFRKKADLQNAGVEIRGGEPAEAFFYGSTVKNRNLWAAQRLSSLAKHDPIKNTVVLMPYGAAHLCAYGHAHLPSLTTQGRLQSLGWQCVQGCGFGDSELYNYNYSGQLREMKKDIPDLDVNRAKSALNMTYGNVQLAKDIYNQGQQNQQQHQQQFSEEKIQQVRDFTKVTRARSLALLAQNGGNVELAIGAHLNDDE